jgi:hypothetical protein
MLATYQTIAFAAIALGSWCWGEFASVAGLRESLTVAGFAALVSLMVARLLPVAVEQLGSLDPRARVELTPPTVEIHAASGPVVVEIEYHVAPENAVEFVAEMNEIGRIRRRDGARAWSICQDIDALDRWIERFECPTWLDYLRWRTRPTESDHAVRARLARLLVGGQNVRRLVVRPRGADPLGAPSASAQGDAAGERNLPGGW